MGCAQVQAKGVRATLTWQLRVCIYCLGMSAFRSYQIESLMKQKAEKQHEGCCGMFAVYGKGRRDSFAGWILYLTVVQPVFVGTINDED